MASYASQQIPRHCTQALRQLLGRGPRVPFAQRANTAVGLGSHPGCLTRSLHVTRAASASSPNDGLTEGKEGHALKSAAQQRQATAAVDRTRSKLPTAKAKAQASKALRQQLLNSKPGLRGGSFPQDAAGAVLQDTPASDAISQRTAALPSATGRPLAARPPTSAHHDFKEVVAWATADSYNLEALARSGVLPPGWSLLEDDEAIHIPQWPMHAGSSPAAASELLDAPPGTGEVFIFRSGTYVSWGLSEEQSQRFLRSVIRRRRPPAADKSVGQVAAAEIEPYEHIGDEAMEWIYREAEPTRIVGDIIVLGRAPQQGSSTSSGQVDKRAASGPIASSEDRAVGEQQDTGDEAAAAVSAEDWSPLLARLAFSQGLARSARLSAQESALDTFLFSLNSIPEQLEKAGKVPLPRREVIRRMGTILRLRQRANLGKDNFLDDPEGHWDNGSMEHHYDAICRSLDIEPRFRALNEKLDYGENLLGVIRALLTERSSHRMELIIIYLIAFEATLAMISHDYIPSPYRIYRLLIGKPMSPSPADASVDAHNAGTSGEIGLTIGLLRRAPSLLDIQSAESESVARTDLAPGAPVRLV